ncbi:MAG TPA: MoxR family ATPase [Chthoniobacterales bacterium]|nr:MoxR family ATPase [Chthoniobacterales bacterium]
MNASLDELKQLLSRARSEVAKVVIGQEEPIRYALIAIFTNQHALVEGVPGVAKTLLVKTLAHILGSPFNRIQFTPDLMPSDIIGTNTFHLQKNEFTFIPGPIFTTFLLADEVNRAPSKTQSALLQAMQERQVTVDRQTYSLAKNFTVFATQNPVEFEGTYPLPEAQKDRFMLKIRVGLPERAEELELANRMLSQNAPEAVLGSGTVQQVVSEDHLVRLRNTLVEVLVKPELIAYLVDIVRETRQHESVLVGAGPRATQALLLASRANAAIDGRDFVTPDDIRTLANGILEHRLILRPEFEIEGTDTLSVIRKILDKVPVPR